MKLKMLILIIFIFLAVSFTYVWLNPQGELAFKTDKYEVVTELGDTIEAKFYIRKIKFKGKMTQDVHVIFENNFLNNEKIHIVFNQDFRLIGFPTNDFNNYKIIDEKKIILFRNDYIRDDGVFFSPFEKGDIDFSFDKQKIEFDAIYDLKKYSRKIIILEK
jgi:hypothetical protein